MITEDSRRYAHFRALTPEYIASPHASTPATRPRCYEKSEYVFVARIRTQYEANIWLRLFLALNN
jgi:hypothetical protein